MMFMPQVDEETRKLMGEVEVKIASIPKEGRIMMRVIHPQHDRITESIAQTIAQTFQIMGMRVTLYK